MTRSNDGYRFSRRTLLKSTAAAAALAPLGRLWIPARAPPTTRSRWAW
ncbi:twin-arginine translocation signal domain-containing protein [Tistrella bauzanensis]